MADYDTLTSSTEQSRPLEVYTFTLGTNVYRYTSAEDTITIGLDSYTPEAITRTQVGQGSDSGNRSLTITVPSGNEFAEKYISIVPGQTATVTVVRLQRDETPTFNTQVLQYKGEVQSITFSKDGHAAEISVRSLATALNRRLPRFTYLGQCNHVLFDQRCKVSSAAFNVVGAVTAETGNTITVTGASAKPNGYYTGGYCKPTSTSDWRLIIDHTGNVLTLLLPFAEPVISQDVQVFAGCDHKLTGDCATKFDNVAEFGGFAFVPNKNVFETGLQ